MNDSLLEVPEPRYSEVERLSSQVYNDEEGLSPTKYDRTEHNLMERQCEIADKITLNNIRCIAILHILPFAAVISSLLNPQWFLLAQENVYGYNYWVNLLFIQKWQV